MSGYNTCDRTVKVILPDAARKLYWKCYLFVGSWYFSVS